MASTKVVAEGGAIRVQDTEFISFTAQRTVSSLIFVAVFTLLFLNEEE